MAFDEIQYKKIEIALEEYIKKVRPPEEIRDELDIAYRIENQSVYISEIRPQWDDKKKKEIFDVAKTTYVANQKIWKILWMRRDLKWHSYEPDPVVDNIEEFIKIVENDEYGCFWG